MKRQKVINNLLILFALSSIVCLGQEKERNDSGLSKILVNKKDGSFQFSSRSDTQWLYLYDSIKKINKKEILSVSGGIDKRKMKFVYRDGTLFLKIFEKNKIVFFDKFASLKEPTKKLSTIYIRSNQYDSYIVKSYIEVIKKKDTISVINELNINNKKMFIRFLINKCNLIPIRIEYVWNSLDKIPSSILISE